FDGLSLKPDSMRILIGFAPNPANPRKIRWWLYCYAWWLDDFLGNFSYCNFADNREYIETPGEIKATVLALLADLNDEEWIYWCIDDKYPILLQLPQIKSICNYIEDQNPETVSGILFCRARRMMDNQFLTDGSLLIGHEILLERSGESLFLRKIFPGFLLEKSAKITRPPMPSAAQIRPRHLVSTQQGVET
ncbi:MAG: hypothetical protein QX188_08010, partial [Methylococcaceae bacterium]